MFIEIWKDEPDSVERTLEFLSKRIRLVLLDCEASFEDINLAVIGFSNWIYLWPLRKSGLSAICPAMWMA